MYQCTELHRRRTMAFYEGGGILHDPGHHLLLFFIDLIRRTALHTGERMSFLHYWSFYDSLLGLHSVRNFHLHSPVWICCRMVPCILLHPNMDLFRPQLFPRNILYDSAEEVIAL